MGLGKIVQRPTTVIMNIHDIDHLHTFDLVLFIERRRVADFGNYNDLMEQRGKLWQYLNRSAMMSADVAGNMSLNPLGLKRQPMFNVVCIPLRPLRFSVHTCKVLQLAHVASSTFAQPTRPSPTPNTALPVRAAE